jgi:primase-polymerase (primpol)-like protein
MIEKEEKGSIAMYNEGLDSINNLRYKEESQTRISYNDIEKEYDELKKKLSKFENDLECAKNEESSDEKVEKIMEIKDIIAKTKNELRYCNPEINRKAFEILEKGNPLKYIMDQFSKMHIGDEAIAKVMVLSIINTSILNTEGLQPKLSGESGKGKTHCAKSVYHLMFDAPYKMQGSLSAKSLYYDNSLVDGVIIFSDDIKMNDDLESTLKIAMTNYQDVSKHHTIIKGEKKTMELPKRICWWLTSVESDFSAELINRLYDQNVDESSVMDEKVYKNIFERAESGALAFPESEEIEICRAIFHIIKRQLFQVKIPFASKFIVLRQS